MKSNTFFTSPLDGNILDVVFPVCKGPSRISKKWTNTEMTWGKLAEQTAQTKRTPETMAEYMAMSRDQQAKIKDVGGVVCGLLKHDKTSADELAGRKTKENILSRSILTFDLDECPAGFSPEPLIREKLPGVAAIGYTTHKHTPEAPRWRVFIPLSEWVSPFYYEAMARKVGAEIGMQFMDKTTFQYNRLMYWPSTAKDGEFLHFALEGLPISPRELVKAHPELKRESSWPRHPDEEQLKPQSIMTEKEGVYNNLEKPQASVEKPGVIGAFCRAYSIDQAIAKFLPGVYIQAGLGRYTYANGSSSKGLVVYDGQLAYSNHATDPANTGHDINAFDLVRIHKYGHLDVGTSTGQKGNTLPSYQAMISLAAADEKVARIIQDEKIKEAAAEFAEVGEDPKDLEWIRDLETDKKGQICNTNANQDLIILNDHVFRTIMYNDFTRQNEVGDTKALRCTPEVDDTALRNIATRYETKYGLKVSMQKVQEILSGVQVQRRYNPLHQYITKEKWDEVPRLETVFIEYLGADDTPLNRAMTRKWMIAAVARAFEPGCKFDNMLILEGQQEIGKSLILRILANGKTRGGYFFSESMQFDMKDSEQIEAMNKAWICEFAELSGLKSVKDGERIKRFISIQEDEKRLAYRHSSQTFKRHCVFAGTTNESTFLADTSARKFWIIHVAGNSRPVAEWVPDLIANVHQIWAEAYHYYYSEGERLELPRQLIEDARAMQAAYNAANGDPLFGILQQHLERLLPSGWRELTRDERERKMRNYSTEVEFMNLKRNKVCAGEIKDEIPEATTPQYVNRLLELLGWKDQGRVKVDDVYGQQRHVFFRPGTDGDDELVTIPEQSETNAPLSRIMDDDDL